jgi:hypothetical protein
MTNYLDLASIPAPAASGAQATAKVDLSDIGDPTKGPDHSLSFSEFLSAINPLQHIPVVGSLYRAATGEQILPAARVLGGALLGGPVGLIASAFNAGLEQATGKDLGDKALAWLTPASTGAAPSAQYAELQSPTDGTLAATGAATAPTPSTPSPSLPSAGAPATASASAAPAPVQAAAIPVVAAAPVPAGAPVGAPVAADEAASAAAPGATAAASPVGLLGSAAGKPGNSGWTLANYRAAAGHGLPVSNLTNSSLHTAPVPLQTTVPLADFARTPMTPTQALAGVPASPSAAAGAVPAAAPADGGEGWVSQAMLRGLDRYREMKKLQEQSAPAAAGSGSSSL